MLSTSYWLSLSRETRKMLSEKLDIPKSGNVEVEYNGTEGRVVCDGYTSNDLLSVTTEKLQNILNSKETDFYKLLESLIEQKETIIKAVVSIDEETNEEIEEEIENETLIDGIEPCDHCKIIIKNKRDEQITKEQETSQQEEPKEEPTSQTANREDESTIKKGIGRKTGKNSNKR